MEMNRQDTFTTFGWRCGTLAVLLLRWLNLLASCTLNHLLVRDWQGMTCHHSVSPMRYTHLSGQRIASLVLVPSLVLVQVFLPWVVLVPMVVQ